MARVSPHIALALFGLAIACSPTADSVTPPVSARAQSRLRPSATPAHTLSSVGDLSVYINGLNKATKEQFLKFTAVPSGGTAPYYYIWSEHVCRTDGTCIDNKIDEGLNLNVINHLIRSDWDYVNIEVQVAENSGVATAITQKDVLGPGAMNNTGGGGWPCDRIPSYYPFHTWESDPAQQKAYYRSSCDGSKQFAPSGWPIPVWPKT